ncbi:hypothetical protein EYF80_044989 [Liparis tanakae]|uniref:Uncharacterized protein n=1 Tax=Liparis tanakae TaxID=230148 RepID=A0A4Z2FW39_9TELE|nr:hypothetical protein EYF80_044989 [Liparis tanakae]
MRNRSRTVASCASMSHIRLVTLRATGCRLRLLGMDAPSVCGYEGCAPQVRESMESVEPQTSYLSAARHVCLSARAFIFLHHEQLVALRLQLSQLAGDKVPLEGRVLASSSEGHVFGEAVAAPPSSSSSSSSSFFALLSLRDVPTLALLPSGLCHPILSLTRSGLVGYSGGGGGGGGSFRLLLGRPVGCKAIPDGGALSGARWRRLRLHREWTEDLERAEG